MRIGILNVFLWNPHTFLRKIDYNSVFAKDFCENNRVAL